mgnify:FL=1
MKKVIAIAAMDLDHAIGDDQGLLWHLPRDLKHFKKTTDGRTVIVGRKTFELMPNLPNRKVIVVSQKIRSDDKVNYYTSIEEAIDSTPDDVYIIGGRMIYQAAIPYLTDLNITLVHTRIEKDNLIYFPEIDLTPYQLKELHYYDKDDINPYPMSILSYTRTP